MTFRSLLNLLATALVLTGCDNDADITYPSFAPTALTVSKLAPMVGERVHYSIGGEGVTLARLFQGDVEVTSIVGRPITADTMAGGVATLFGSFVAVSNAPIVAKVYGARDEERELAAQQSSETCFADGIWEGTLTRALAPSECELPDPDEHVARFRVHANAALLAFDDVSLRGYRGAGCTYDFRMSGASPVHKVELSITGDAAQAEYTIETSSACQRAWAGSLQRRVPELP